MADEVMSQDEFESGLYNHVKELTDRSIKDRDVEKFDEKLQNYEKRFESMRSVRGLDYGDLPKSKPWPGCSDIGIPIDAITIQSIVARVDRTEFERLPLTRVQGVGVSDYKSAPKIEAFLDWQKLNLMQIRIPRLMRTRSSLILGGYFEKHVFQEDTLFDTREVYGLWDPDLGEVLREGGEIVPWDVDESPPLNESSHAYVISEVDETYEKTVYRGPKVYGRHPKNILWDKAETSYDPNEWDWWADTYERTLEWFELNGAKAGFKNIDQLKSRAGVYASSLNQPLDKKRPIKVREWYGLYVVDEKPRYIVAAIAPELGVFLGWTHDKIRVKSGKTRLVHRCPIPMEGSVLGMSIPKFIKGLRDAIDVFFNQMADRGSRSSNPPIIYAYGSGFDPSRHNFGYRFWPEKTPGTIRELQMSHNETIEIAKIDMLLGLVQRLFGVTDTTSGIENPMNQTYGGISTLLAEGNVNIDMIIQTLSQANVVGDELIIAVNSIYIKRDESGNALPVEFPLIDDYSSVMEDPDNPFATMTEEELLGKYNYIPTGSSLNINTRSIREESMFLYKTVVESAGVNPFAQDLEVMHGATEDLFKSFGKKAIRISTVEEMQQKLAAQAQAAQAQAAQQ